MREKIEWMFDKGSVSEEIIKTVEEKFGVIFPANYKEIVKENNGAQPVPDVYDFEGRKEAVMNSLLHFNLEEQGNIIDVYEKMKDRLPELVYPFANDPFGNLICFDYRNNSKNPEVVFWNHEETEGAISHICDSFNELLFKLYDPEEQQS
ncbi:SMI1/KNR4 family protein [Fuchsiella alkaliacetigena]|uniref:SMI1/KNR4 family protein n=1 Tax=Fuchsiella alkaliacetigena TaxID=957042 RepID=UPI00200A761B|nr:SMI1/KNR4 family protein [Fuchsiella alkaliacetigena]MCK8823441.1 SMI1/KNR4 family protein [Fuchsiella alkaliacetigena]